MFASVASLLLMLGLVGHGQLQTIQNFGAHSPLHIHKFSNTGPTGLTPSQIKSAYGLPTIGGAGKTIAIVDAYDDTTIASDVTTFSTTEKLAALPACAGNVTTSCFAKYKMSSRITADSGWSLEMSLDVEWAHAIAPQAKILLVEAKSASGTDLLSAIDYARSQPGVVAVSMSWGGAEFSGESSYDPHFATNNGASMQFFASAGDSGTGVSWPAVSPNVVGVGGTTLNLNSNGTIAGETAWAGSGGGVSAYEPKPVFQSLLLGTKYGNFRSTPDVSYDANPSTGLAVYDSTRYNRESGWFQVGGTSAGTPQWAAIDADGGSVSTKELYADAATSTVYSKDIFDIISGTNGLCGTLCTASPGYDTVTGLGSPRTSNF